MVNPHSGQAAQDRRKDERAMRRLVTMALAVTLIAVSVLLTMEQATGSARCATSQPNRKAGRATFRPTMVHDTALGRSTPSPRITEAVSEARSRGWPTVAVTGVITNSGEISMVGRSGPPLVPSQGWTSVTIEGSVTDSEEWLYNLEQGCFFGDLLTGGVNYAESQHSAKPQNSAIGDVAAVKVVGRTAESDGCGPIEHLGCAGVGKVQA